MSKNTQFSLRILPYVVAMTIVIFLPRVESALMPVVKDFVVTSMVRDESSVTISGYLRKVRTCQFVGVCRGVPRHRHGPDSAGAVWHPRPGRLPDGREVQRSGALILGKILGKM